MIVYNVNRNNTRDNMINPSNDLSAFIRQCDNVIPQLGLAFGTEVTDNPAGSASLLVNVLVAEAVDGLAREAKRINEIVKSNQNLFANCPTRELALTISGNAIRQSELAEQIGNRVNPTMGTIGSAATAYTIAQVQGQVVAVRQQAKNLYFHLNPLQPGQPDPFEQQECVIL